MKRLFLVSAAFLSMASSCTPEPVDGGPPPASSPDASNGNGSGGQGGKGGKGGKAGNEGKGGKGGSSEGQGGSGEGGAGPTEIDAAAPTVDAPAGTGDDGPAAGSPDAPAAATGGCAGSTAKFCDDFEGQMAGKAPMGNFMVKGGMVVDSTKAFSGKQSLLIKGPAGSFEQRLTFGAPILPVASNDVHGRAMIFMTKTPGGNTHFDIVDGSGGGVHYILGGMYGNFMAVYHPGDCSVDSKTKFPEGRWACIQWEFKGNKDGTHALRMLMDGQLVDKGEILTMGPANCAAGGGGREWKAPASFTQLKFGWINYQRSAIPVEMWVDDLAIGDQPIPCPPAK